MSRLTWIAVFFLAFLCAPMAMAGDLKAIRDNRLPAIEAALKAKGFDLGAPIYIRVFKDTREMEVWLKVADRFRLYKTFPICNFSGGLGPKQKEGDGKAPEGFYTVSKGQLNPNSQYHLAFNLGYPNAFDRANNRTGSFLMVHGNCVSIGCYAMTDAGIEEIYLLAEAALNGGQGSFRADIYPFRFTDMKMAFQRLSPHYDFWQDLRPAYEAFEATHLPPRKTVRNRRYVVD